MEPSNEYVNVISQRSDVSRGSRIGEKDSSDHVDPESQDFHASDKLSKSFSIERAKVTSTPLKHAEKILPSGKSRVFSNPENGSTLVIDNVDTKVRVSDMTEEHQNIDIHHTAKMAVMHRVNCNHLNDTKPATALSELDHEAFICKASDHTKQRLNYMTLISRIITSSIPALEPFSKFVVNHTPHQYAEEMSKKSESIFLGLIYENENTTQGIMKFFKTCSNINRRMAKEKTK
ncbi:uncharacterized protein [Clytia hemisphaerica]|uniref:Uncharacterized protein n=1 Tax=Clytia hemisphaerica TaxID=252671 RepID=A0A7M6DQ68_9CNID